MSMALSSHTPSTLSLTTTQSSTPSTRKFISFPPPLAAFQFPAKPTSHKLSTTSGPEKWRAKVSFFPAFLNKGKDAKTLKDELLQAIAPLDRGADATAEDQQTVDQVGLNSCLLFPLISFGFFVILSSNLFIFTRTMSLMKFGMIFLGALKIGIMRLSRVW
jgi:hypothetical protein